MFSEFIMEEKSRAPEGAVLGYFVMPFLVIPSLVIPSLVMPSFLIPEAPDMPSFFMESGRSTAVPVLVVPG